jgi:hypothetical protein
VPRYSATTARPTASPRGGLWATCPASRGSTATCPGARC